MYDLIELYGDPYSILCEKHEKLQLSTTQYNSRQLGTILSHEKNIFSVLRVQLHTTGYNSVQLSTR